MLHTRRIQGDCSLCIDANPFEGPDAVTDPCLLPLRHPLLNMRQVQFLHPHQSMNLLIWLLTLVATLSLSLPSLADGRNHVFRFKVVDRQGQTREMKIEKRNNDSMVAYREAAFDCAKQMRAGHRLNDDKILEIVNTCANPRH